MKSNERVLVVDDNERNLTILEELLADDYSVLCASSGADAIRLAPDYRPGVVLLDVIMPRQDGYATCQALRSQPELSATKIIMLSARGELSDRMTAYSLGAVDYLTKPFDPDEVLIKVRTWMGMRRAREIEAVVEEVEKAGDLVGKSLVSLAAFRDTETGDHLFRIRAYCGLLAQELARSGEYCDQIDEQFCRHMERASPLHDIGKVGVDDAVLRKPGPLTPAEYESIKQHCVIGGNLLAQAAAQLPHVKYLAMAADIARHHHERFDGTGYPDRLIGGTTPLAARIVAVADVFDALTSKRVYKEPMPFADAMRIILNDSGTHFDPTVVDAFRTCAKGFRQVHEQFAIGDKSVHSVADGHTLHLRR